MLTRIFERAIKTQIWFKFHTGSMLTGKDSGHFLLQSMFKFHTGSMLTVVFAIF